MKVKKKPKIKKCGNCNNWYSGCYDTDYDFWTGERNMDNCKYFEEKTELDKAILLNKIKTKNLALLFPNLYEAIKLEKESDCFTKELKNET